MWTEILLQNKALPVFLDAVSDCPINVIDCFVEIYPLICVTFLKIIVAAGDK